MTSAYQENGHHTSEQENTENANNGGSMMTPASSQEITALNPIEQQFKQWRQVFGIIATAMDKTTDTYTLTTIVTQLVREKLECDRVLVYNFVSSESGTVTAESKASSWTPALGEKIPAILFGLERTYEYLEPTILQTNGGLEIGPYQAQLLEKYQVKSSLSVPITLNGNFWGLLVVQSCSTNRQWQENEITLLSQVCSEMTKCLLGFDFQNQLQRQSEEHKSVVKVIDKIQRASSLDKIFQTTTYELRQMLECDRVAVYRFNADWSGEFVAESVAVGWTQLVGAGIKTVWEDTHLQETQGGRYRQHENLVANDIYKMGHSACHIEILEQFEIKAYVTIPVFEGTKLWGLLAAYQNSTTREWQDSEIKLLEQFAINFGVAITQVESFEQIRLKTQELTQIASREKALSKVINRIRQYTDLDLIFRTTTQEVRQLLQCDRVSVYCFHPDWSGEYVAESVAPGWMPLVGPDIKTVWEDTHLQETQGGRYARGENFIVNDIHAVGHSPCHIDILEQFQVKAYLIVPVFLGKKLWGLLAAYQNSDVREWQEWEVQFLTQIGLQFGIAVSQIESLRKTQEQSRKLARTSERQQGLISLTRKIGEALTKEFIDSSVFDNILQTTVAEVRRLLESDRTVVYRFNPDWSGEFIAESLAKGWVPFKEKQIDQELLQTNGHCDSIRSLADVYRNKDTYLQDNKGGRYKQRTSFVVNDVSQAGFPPCYTELLDQFEAKAYLTVPIFKENKLWALLASYQHSQTRQWEEFDVSMMEQVAVLLGAAIQQAETFEKLQQQSQKVAKAAELDQAVTEVVDKIRQALDINSIFATTTKEVRSLLQADRVVVFQFKPDWSGEFVAESVGNNWVRLVGPNNKVVWADSYLQETQGGRYRNREYLVVNDMYKMGHADCHVEMLEQYQARAYVIVPVFQGDTLWGLMAAYQNTGPRQWEEIEVNVLMRVSNQVGIALEQAYYLQQLQEKNQEIQKVALRDHAAGNVIDQIRQTLDIDSIFNIATKETRILLDTDRVSVYKFNPDWSGLFTSESVADGWISLVEKQYKIPQLQESISSCYGMRSLFTMSQEPTTKGRIDTYLQATEGGEFRNRKTYVRPDIYKAGFPKCYTDVLEEYQVKAYAIVPIFQGQQLWGVLAAFENSGPRHWEESEVSVLSRIGDQLGVALQQAEFLQQLQMQSLQVTEAAGREKEAKEYLQKGAMQLLSAVRPALNGDLTVRAPITEDELGTIADAYNNTLQALRQIVIQVQAAAQQVASTSVQSNTSLTGLTTLAQQQSKELNEALGEIQQMVDSTQAVVGNAELVQLAVQQANQTVESGDDAMNRTVEAIQAIRETVAQTGKKIKKLSESSQKISKVVNLISNFATQTNVLALNAAIEATRAGEYGKGFAVVADEVRSLSRQSAAATIEIEKLVQEIQEETGEVAVAMESGIQQVVEGTSLVNETRMSLNAIVSATAEISKLLQQIADATQGQMLQSVSVTASMKDVAKIANKTSSEANNIATVFQQISEMAQELLASASKFKVN